MSKVKITGNASGTGVLTVEAPNTNTDRTVTLPDATGTLLMTDGDGSNLTGLSSGGKLLQVVQTHLITTSSTSTPESLNTYVNITDLNATITPAAGSSVRVTVRWNGAVSAQLHGEIFGIRRDSTVIGNPASAGGRPIGMCNLTTNYTNTYSQHTQAAYYSYVDSSPGGDGSTAITYHAIATNGGNGCTVYTNRTVSDSSLNDYERLTSTIILEEIGA